MSLLLEHIENHPKETKRLIGIDYEQLQQLFTQASAIHHQGREEISKFRVNSSGAGCKPKLSLDDQILFLTLVSIAASIWVSESTNNIFHYWLDILTELLPASLLEQVKKKTVT